MIAAIEDAIIDAVKAADLGYKLGTIASYGGELAQDENALAVLLRQFPAVWVSFNHETQPVPFNLNKRKWLVTGTFLVLVATRSARGERFTRHSVAKGVEVGAYQIISDLRLLLLNQDLGLKIEPFKPGPVKSLFNKKLLNQTMAVYAVELHCKYVIEQPEEALRPAWTSINFNYYLRSTSEAVPDAVDSFPLPFTD